LDVAAETQPAFAHPFAHCRLLPYARSLFWFSLRISSDTAVSSLRGWLVAVTRGKGRFGCDALHLRCCCCRTWMVSPTTPGLPPACPILQYPSPYRCTCSEADRGFGLVHLLTPLPCLRSGLFPHWCEWTVASPLRRAALPLCGGSPRSGRSSPVGRTFAWRHFIAMFAHAYATFGAGVLPRHAVALPSSCNMLSPAGGFPACASRLPLRGALQDGRAAGRPLTLWDVVLGVCCMPACAGVQLGTWFTGGRCAGSGWRFCGDGGRLLPAATPHHSLLYGVV